MEICRVNNIFRFASIKFTSTVDHLGLLILVLELSATVVLSVIEVSLKVKEFWA